MTRSWGKLWEVGGFSKLQEGRHLKKKPGNCLKILRSFIVFKKAGNVKLLFPFHKKTSPGIQQQNKNRSYGWSPNPP